MEITIGQIREMQKFGLIKNTVNVGIKPDQVFFIKKLVEKNLYKSINEFTQKAVEKELKFVLKQEGVQE